MSQAWITVPDWQTQFRLPYYSCGLYIPSPSHRLTYHSKVPSPSHHYESGSSLRHWMVVKVPPYLEWPCYYPWPLLVQFTWLGPLYGCIRHPWLWHLLRWSLDCRLLASHPEGQLNTVEGALPHRPFLPFVGHLWSGKKILFHCDNQPVVDIWASGTSRDPLIMHLVRSIFLSGATHHFTVLVSHIVGTDNSIADAVSRFQMVRFCHLAQQQNWDQHPFLPQPRLSGRSPSIPSITSYSWLHSLFILRWYPQVLNLLHLGMVAKLPSHRDHHQHQTECGHLLSMPSSYHHGTSLPNQVRVSKSPRHPPSW